MTENDFQNKENSESFVNLVKYQIDRAKSLFEKGHKLIPLLPKQLRFQIRLTILGGEEILKKIELLKYDTLNSRPVLSKLDYFKLIIRALLC